MKVQNLAGTLMVLASLSMGVVSINNAAAGESGYSFKVHNNTRTKITKLLVSEDKKNWGYFDIGQGIAAGGDMTLTWDESTNNEGCDQYVKAAYSDGSESEEAKFNFCEANLELEF
ncbi:hypothetical protein [Methylobacter sp.]|uniref:hypothetical protein n=1 Tax=Methylobacter sp. TaxID=2051955 RepID=UPI002FDE13EB